MADLKRSAAAWQVGVCDAHCHPTDIMSATPKIAKMKAKVLTIMATRAQDQDLVVEVANKYPTRSKEEIFKNGDSRHVIPSFGWHPWFSYQMWDDRNTDIEEIDAIEHFKSVLTPAPEDYKFLNSLPQPLRLSEYLKQTEDRLQKYPFALVGEVGLDRSFRVPYGPFKCPPDPSLKFAGPKAEHTEGSREGRPLSPHRVQMEHQKLVLKAQLELAAQYNRAVSVHGVAAHGVVFDLLQSLWQGHERQSKRSKKQRKQDSANIPVDEQEEDKDRPKPYPPRICLHSFSGPPDNLKQYLTPKIPASIFFSFSELINFNGKTDDKSTEVIKSVPDDKILIESDLHCAGYEMDRLLEGILRRVCNIKGWSTQEGAKTLRANWEQFVFGNDEKTRQ